jgi:hypothetical protein
MIKKWLIFGAFGLALVVNPYLACSSKEDDFSYSESEFKDAVLGTWQGTADLDGEQVEFSLVLEQASAKSKTQSLAAPKVKPQCGTRSFVKPAAACISMSQMPLVGTLTSVNPELNGAIDGEVQAYQDLGPADVTLRLEGGKELRGVIKSQALSDGRISASTQLGTFSLTRP